MLQRRVQIVKSLVTASNNQMQNLLPAVDPKF
jgi:hypothetical protein